MSGYVLRTAESKAVKKLIKRYGTVQIQTESIDGVIEIVGYRTYMGHEEVDINFKGKIFVGMGYARIWVDYKYYQSQIKSISKIKLTRFFRKKCLDVVQTQMLFFGARINYPWHIKKVKWVG